MKENIIIGLGISNIKFGMLEKDVISIIGKPISIENTSEFLNDERKTYKYLNFSIEFTKLDESEFYLTGIDVNTNSITLNNKEFINEELSEVIEYCELHSFSKATIENINNELCPNHLLLFYDKENIIFSFINYKCDSFFVGPYWKNEDKYDFPL